MNELSSRNYLQETIKLKNSIEGAYIDLGSRLKKIRDERLFEGQYDSFGEFLNEIDMSEGTASRIISVISFYFEKHGVKREKLSQAGWSNLYSLMKLTDENTPKKRVEEVVEKAIVLRREDIQEEIRDHKHPECRHEWRELHLKICLKCNKREQIHGN